MWIVWDEGCAGIEDIVGPFETKEQAEDYCSRQRLLGYVIFKIPEPLAEGQHIRRWPDVSGW